MALSTQRGRLDGDVGEMHTADAESFVVVFRTACRRLFD